MKNRLLVLSAATVLLGGGAFAATGNLPINQPQLIAQESSPPTGAPEGRKGPRHEKFTQQLGLTEAQQTQLKQIHQETHQQIKAIPTAEQKAQMEAIRAEANTKMEAVLTDEQRQQLQETAPTGNGQRKGPGFRKLSNLSEAQRTQLRQIHQETHQQKDGILTAEQKAQIKAIREAQKSKMDAVLSDQQRQKLQELRQQKQDHRQ